MIKNTDKPPINYTACCTLADLTHQPTIEAEKIKNAKRGDINFYLCDNIEFMKTKPDKYYDLAIVDPPYGIGMDGTIGIGIGKKKGFTKKKHYAQKDWDKAVPAQEYFDELFRVSKNQIIWGANYFTKQLPVIKNYIFWYKKGQSVDNKFNDGELAYTSVGRTRMVDIWWNGVGVINSGETKIHPTQKPTKLYRWLLHNYAKDGYKILDTHGGSMTHAVACDMEGFDLDICEIDKEYFDNGVKAFNIHKLQYKLF